MISLRTTRIVAAAVALHAWLAASTWAAGLRWEKHLSAAFKAAKASGRVVMVSFWADWCPWCRQLDETTYKDPEVVRLAQRLVPVKVDNEGGLAEIALADRHRVSSLPTVLFLSPEARVVWRVDRFMGPGEFPEAMRAALKAGETVMAWEAALAKDTRDARALAALGAHLVEVGASDDGRKLLERARKVDRARPVGERQKTRLWLARIRASAGRFRDAESLLREGQALSGDALDLRLELARVYLGWKNPERARAELTLLLDDCRGGDSACAQAGELLRELEGRP